MELIQILQGLQTVLSLSSFIYPVFFILAVVVGVFLFWREASHELIKSEHTFDLTVVSVVGAIVVSRIFEFIVRYEYFEWSLGKFLFFNVFPGLDFWGALIGAGLAIYLLSTQKKFNFFHVLDLATVPAALFFGIIAFGDFVAGLVGGTFNLISIYFAISYFFLFLIIKRLFKRKRHLGFFISFFLIAISILNLASFILREEVMLIGGLAPYEIIAPVAFLALGTVIWYRVAKRSVRKDIKGLFAHILLFIFKTRRVLSTIEEADSLSKAIVLSPYTLLVKLSIIFRYIGKEIYNGTLDFLYALGVKR